jgi:hypothetical protein
MMGFLYILIGFGAFIVVTTIVWHWRMRRHRGVPRDAFIGEFRPYGIPDEIPAVVYDYYRKGMLFKGFGIAPEDSYEHVLSELEEDVDGDALLLVEKLGLKLPPPEIVRAWRTRVSGGAPSLSLDPALWTHPIRTVRDMVLWLDFVRQHQNVISSK